MAGVLGYKLGALPIPYLGMKVGGRVKGVADWVDLVDRVKCKLWSWDVKTLSIGGRATLINSIIAAILIYRLSFAQMPKAVANQVRSLQCNFLWGGNEGSRKMAWIKWDTICKSKKEGGLGIKNLLKVNTALLLKWVWRFLGEEESLWTCVIKSRHGTLMCGREEVWLGDGGGRRAGGGGKWWRWLKDMGGKWFREKLNLKLGDGKSANFWEGIWAGESTVKDRFLRLFQLSGNKNGKVAEMGRWVDGGWRWEFAWRRDLFEREKGAVEDLSTFLGNFNLVEGRPDHWQRGRTKNGSFSVKEAYKEISEDGSGLTEVEGNFGEFRGIWKSYAPFKAQLMTWRLFWNRLPTGDNLSKVFVIPSDERVCCGCKMVMESASHLFLQCAGVSGIWNKMVDWVGVKWVLPRRVGEHFYAFSSLLGGKESRKRLGGLWVFVVWVF